MTPELFFQFFRYFTNIYLWSISNPAGQRRHFKVVLEKFREALLTRWDLSSMITQAEKILCFQFHLFSFSVTFHAAGPWDTYTNCYDLTCQNHIKCLKIVQSNLRWLRVPGTYYITHTKSFCSFPHTRAQTVLQRPTTKKKIIACTN